jgi:hypothetical protein
MARKRYKPEEAVDANDPLAFIHAHLIERTCHDDLAFTNDPEKLDSKYMIHKDSPFFSWLRRIR